ncbi:MAG: Tn3 family transposase [Gammaproteobacteria bacterium]|nr:Tn3 family transposase [Gammaproteobacteria bacterium]
MARRSILSATERDNLIALPNDDLVIQYYTFNESDLAVIKQHRGSENRLGFAMQLCYLRYPGVVLGDNNKPSPDVIEFIAKQLNISPSAWERYGSRKNTFHEHLLELQTIYGFRSFTLSTYREKLAMLEDLAMHTDKGIVLAATLIEQLRGQHILLPSINVMERLCSEAITKANRRIYQILTENLSDEHYINLDGLLHRKPESKFTWLVWLRQSPSKPSSRQMLEHIERLKVLQKLNMPEQIYRSGIHQNRLLKIAREGGQMTPQDLSKFEPVRRYATLVTLVLESTATITDEIIDLHDRIIGRLFNVAKNKHHKRFQKSGKDINSKIRIYGKIGQALVSAKQDGTDPFKAIESVISWDEFEASVMEAQKLAQPESFDFLALIGDSYSTLRRYAPAFLDALKIQATPASQDIVDGIAILRSLNTENNRKLPLNAPTSFIRKRWQDLVFKDKGIDRRYYELCLLSELKGVLRSGDAWVQGSRQFKDFNTYLVTPEKYTTLKQNNELPLKVATDCDQYLYEHLTLLESELIKVNQMAAADDLPDAVITESGLKITPLDAVIPENAQKFIDQATALLPHVKITELLLEVDQWTNFTRHFTHLKSGELAKDKNLLLTTILADGINLGLSKMSESCPGTTYSKLAWLQAWHIRDETYSAALAELTNAQFKHPFAANWGDGTTSSSDGQRFRTGGVSQGKGQVNPKYGAEPGRQFYTHLSDQYAPYHTRAINVGVRDSTYVLDGLLYHESDLRIEEHYTDTAGFTDQVFGMMHLLGFKLAPRIKDLGETKLFAPPKQLKSYPALQTMISEELKINCIKTQWDDILRLAVSIQQGTATASLLLRKLSSYPRQNGLAVALRELGRIERSLFILEWLQSVELRRRVTAGLNKGEARNALARAVFFNRLGEIRDRSYEQQRYRASGLTLLTAAIILWNTVYMERAVEALKKQGVQVNPDWYQYLSPLGWEHINLTGDYIWDQSKIIQEGKFRPLRTIQNP